MEPPIHRRSVSLMMEKAVRKIHSRLNRLILHGVDMSSLAGIRLLTALAIGGLSMTRKLLLIGTPGDWIDLDTDGNVYVNNVKIDDPYLMDKALGDCNIELPYQVPESRVFVMGDNRSVSVDSRNTAVGCVAEEQIVGKIVFRVWPVETFGQIG